MEFKFNAEFSNNNSFQNNLNKIDTIDIVDNSNNSNEYSNEEEIYQDNNDDEKALIYYMPNAPIEAGKLSEWQKNGRTIKFELHPLKNDGIMWISNKSNDDEKNKIENQVENELFLIESNDDYDKDEYFKLICKFHDFFEKLDEVDRPLKGLNGNENELVAPNTPGTLKDFSPRFFKIMLKIINSLILNTPSLETNDLIDALVISECVGIIYFNTHPDGIAKGLMEWVNRTDPEPSTEEAKAIMMCQPPLKYPYFWDYIYRCALRGLFGPCANTLNDAGFELIDPSSVNCLKMIILLLQSFNFNSFKTFSSEYLDWRAQVIELDDDIDYIENRDIKRGFKNLTMILRGDSETIIKLSNTWYENVAALLLLHDSDTNQLSHYYYLSINSHPLNMSVLWEVIVADILLGNIAKFLALTESLDLCVAAHLADLCERHGLLLDYLDLSDNLGIRDWLILQHGVKCLSNLKTFFFGIDYLISLDLDEATDAIGNAITRYNIQSTEVAYKLLDICKRLGLQVEYLTISRTWSRKLYSNSYKIDAIKFAIENGNKTLAKDLLWKYFEETLINNKQIEDESKKEILLYCHNTENCSKELREVLSPLMVLILFYQHRDSGDLKLAGNYLISLLTFPYLPKRLIGLLFYNVFGILEATSINHYKNQESDYININFDNGLVFDTQQLIVLLGGLRNWEEDEENFKNSLKDVEKFIRYNPVKTGQDKVTIENLVLKLRLEIAHQVSKVYLDGPGL